LFRSAKTRLSLFLGLLMLTFGFLKFVNPTIDGWFHVQIQQSHLPHAAILMGKLGEITTGVLFVLPRLRRWPSQWARRILLLACSSLFVEMLVAVYVHLQPEVPAEVLPLGIKPPIIPLFVVLLDVIVAVAAWKDSRLTHQDTAIESVVATNSLLR
jgi:uncharacterized membrane protein YphA (DoxX/SURF4 family)